MSLFAFIPGKLYHVVEQLYIYKQPEDIMICLNPEIDPVMFIFEGIEYSGDNVVKGYLRHFLSPKFGVFTFHYWAREPNEKFFVEYKSRRQRQ
jgi:hypothetical protein